MHRRWRTIDWRVAIIQLLVHIAATATGYRRVIAVICFNTIANGHDIIDINIGRHRMDAHFVHQLVEQNVWRIDGGRVHEFVQRTTRDVTVI